MTSLFNQWRDLSNTLSGHMLSRKLIELQKTNPSEWQQLIADLKTTREIDAKLVGQWLRGETHKCPVCGSETLRTTTCCSRKCQHLYDGPKAERRPTHERFAAPPAPEKDAIKFLDVKECTKGVVNSYVKAGWRVQLSSDNATAWSTSLNRWSDDAALEVKAISSATGIAFLSEHDVIGADKHLGQYFYGGYYNNKLVAVLSFDTARYSRVAQYEMTRICTLGFNPKAVFDLFVSTNHPQSIVAYASERYSFPDQYEALGFKLDHATEYSYYYLKDGVKYPRQQFMKHKLVAEGYDPNKTESQIMEERGFDKVYDCGNLVYVWRKPVK